MMTRRLSWGGFRTSSDGGEIAGGEGLILVARGAACYESDLGDHACLDGARQGC